MHAIVITAPKGKRRRILDSDDEGEAKVLLGALFAHAFESTLITAAVTSTRLSSTRRVDSGERKRKGNTAKVQPRLKNTNDTTEMARKNPNDTARMRNDDEAPTAENGDEHHVDEEDDFLASDGEESEAAAKNAQLAASHVIDVDIDGGWKVGSP